MRHAEIAVELVAATTVVAATTWSRTKATATMNPAPIARTRASAQGTTSPDRINLTMVRNSARDNWSVLSAAWLVFGRRVVVRAHPYLSNLSSVCWIRANRLFNQFGLKIDMVESSLIIDYLSSPMLLSNENQFDPGQIDYCW